jgi:methylphosphotriester-DNA--protein-cysteine methyltransferase
MFTRSSRLDTAIQLSLNADETVTVGMLAQCAGLSQSRFSHLFARQTGILPGEFLQLMKTIRREQRWGIEIIGEALRANGITEVGNEARPKPQR